MGLRTDGLMTTSRENGSGYENLHCNLATGKLTAIHNKPKYCISEAAVLKTVLHSSETRTYI